MQLQCILITRTLGMNKFHAFGEVLYVVTKALTYKLKVPFDMQGLCTYTVHIKVKNGCLECSQFNETF